MDTLINHLRSHQANAAGCFSTLTGQRSDFIEGYLMAIGHALELAEVIEARRQQEGK